jgi:hypothetical protein
MEVPGRLVAGGLQGGEGPARAHCGKVRASRSRAIEPSPPAPPLPSLFASRRGATLHEAIPMSDAWLQPPAGPRTEEGDPYSILR